uniref:MIP10831p1 n=1 Tax=Drosophila melanogaster TaxID=7227 RepID=G2J610_DROME|nr:MIP10831p1 [Drosophila melanogaster]
MKILYLTCALLASFAVIWAASGEEESEQEEGPEKLAKQHGSRPHPGQGFKLISFDAVGKHIALGLDYLVPFLEVPVKRKRNAPPKPLVVVNSAAVVSCGLVVAGGVLVGHLIRSLGLEAITGDDQHLIFGNSSTHKPKSSEEEGSSSTPAPKNSTNATARGLFDDNLSFPGILDNFKLIYRNETGDRVATNLPNILGMIERTFLKNDVDLTVCLLKSICTLTHNAGEKVSKGQASDFEHLLDGATKWSWLLAWLDQSAFRDAIEAGKSNVPHHCAIKYPECKWVAPEEQIMELLHNNVQFK